MDESLGTALGEGDWLLRVLWSLEQLDAVRHDLDSDGWSDHEAYAAAFPLVGDGVVAGRGAGGTS